MEPADDGTVPIHYLSLTEFGERGGLSLPTIKRYYYRGALPAPDAVIGRNKGWAVDSCDTWYAIRPGPGARTDLIDRPADKIPIHYLSLTEFGERGGLSLAAMKGYYHRLSLPVPDARIGRNQGWSVDTCDTWLATRPARRAPTADPATTE
jgi:predicted DNA-binding transcriptional regulator AlpA